MLEATMHSRRCRGAALFVALSISILLAVFVTALVEMVTLENDGTDSLVLDTQARYLAESGAEYAIRRLKVNIANSYTLPQGANVVVLSGRLPGYEPALPGSPPKPVVDYRVVRIEAAATRSSVDPDGVTHRYQTYAVSGRGYVPDPGNPSRYNEIYINKMVDLDFVPLFQYLAFYNRFDLEMLPGNNATLKGRIHSNRDLYTGAESGTTLTINTFSMRASGGLQRHRKNTTPSASNHYMTGTVRVKRGDKPETATVNDTNYPIVPARGTLKTQNNTTVPTSEAPSGYDSNFNGYDGNNDGDVADASDLGSFADGVGEKWAGSVGVGANGVPVLEAPTDIRAYRPPVNTETATHKYDPVTKMWVPAAGSAATHVQGYYLQQAGLVVVSNGTKTQMLAGAGTVLLEMNGGTVTTNNLKDASNVAIVPLSEKQMFDGREYNASQDGATNGKIKVTEIDVGKLNQARYNGAPIFSAAGSGSIIYAYRTDTTAASPNGIRLTNGAVLNNKMTFVSEDPVYVKGNFNTAAGGKKGVVLIGDSMNLLSNQWNDTKVYNSSPALPTPTADLEFNGAVMSGAYETVAPDAAGNGGKYNGGFENFPRFHEDWSASGRAVNIQGSFVSLIESNYAQGNWVYGSRCYSAPVRNWNFDPSFLDPGFCPPGFLHSVGESRVVWWRGRQMEWWP